MSSRHCLNVFLSFPPRLPEAFPRTAIISALALRLCPLPSPLFGRMGSWVSRGVIHQQHRVVQNVQHVSVSSKTSTMDAALKLPPIVISGPSGAGKSTLLKRAMREHPGIFALSVSHTTRQPRSGEQDGVDYYFVSREEMLANIENGEFIEHAQFGGNLYGTSRRAVHEVAKQNKLCILDLEMQGCESLKKLQDFSPLYIFVQPPDLDSLERRLRERNTETEESLNKRMAEAKSALDYGSKPGNFDVVIVNDDLEKAYAKFVEALNPLIKEAKELQSNLQHQ
eukprot:m.33822 g.33822  ORF g.33822 m.33822 type:complete len:282 (+) comp10935_c0_seq2:166-1011(+)